MPRLNATTSASGANDAPTRSSVHGGRPSPAGGVVTRAAARPTARWPMPGTSHGLGRRRQQPLPLEARRAVCADLLYVGIHRDLRERLPRRVLDQADHVELVGAAA